MNGLKRCAGKLNVYTLNTYGTPPSYHYPFDDSAIHTLAASWEDALAGKGVSSWLTVFAACPMAQPHKRCKGISGKESIFVAAGIV